MTTTKTRPGTGSQRGGKVSGLDLVPGTNLDQYVAPWVVLALLPVVGAIGHRASEGTVWRWAAPVLLVAGGAGLGMLAWLDAKPRKPTIRWRVVVSVIGALTSLAVVVAIGPAANWLALHLIVGGLVALSWNVIRTEAVRGIGEDSHEQKPDQLREELGLHNLHVRSAEKMPDGRVRAKLIHRGHPRGDVQKAAEVLATHAGVPESGVRVGRDPDAPTDAGKSEMVIVPKDVLRQPRVFPGPSRPGGSIAEPCRIGVYEDGEDLEILRPGCDPDPARGVDARRSVHTATSGETGSGKTDGALGEAAEVCTRRDVVLWWADRGKSDQSLPDILPAVDWPVTSLKDTRAMVAAVLAMIPARAAEMGTRHKQWTPATFTELGIPYLIVRFEEAADIMAALGAKVTEAVRKARSVGISIDISMQRHSHTSIPTDLRSQLTMSWAYRLADDTDSGMVLSEGTLAAGAAPWEFQQPGYCYLEASHRPRERWATPARTFHVPSRVLRGVVAEWAPRMARLDDASAQAAGEAYAARPRVDFAAWLEESRTQHGLVVPASAPSRSSVLAVPSRPVPVPAPRQDDEDDEAGEDDGTAQGGTEDDEDEETMEIWREEAREETAEDLADAEAEMGLEPMEDGPDLTDEDWSEELEPEQRAALDVPLGDGAPPATAEEKARHFAAVVESARAERGSREVRTSHLLDLWYELPGITQVQRPGFMERLSRLAAEGAAEHLGYGKWRLLESAPAVAAAWVFEDTDSDDDAVLTSGGEQWAAPGAVV